jgi:SAM-dependent methyltransferase/heme-degrading monooxygenase HmoA/ribosomal protein S18 acetylase RimI-like enzyme
MILESVILNIILGKEQEFEKNFAQAEKIIIKMNGYIDHELQKSLEHKNIYLLLVKWETIEDHQIGFRKSPEYQEWKGLLHHFYDPFPEVKYFQLVGLNQEIKIRKYQVSDADDLAKIYYNTIHKICSKDYTGEQLNAWAPSDLVENYSGWKEKLAKIKPLIAVVDNKIVGFAEFEDNGHIDCFYIHHQFQGKKIGSKLIEEIEKIAKQKNLPRIYAEVSITAKPFFENKGFKVSKKQKVLIRGEELNNFVMEKLFDENTNSMGLPAEYQQIPEYFDKHNICDDTELKNSVVEKLLDKQNVKNILDMTCGTGSQVFYLTKKGYKITGSDFSPELIKLARKKAKKQNLNIEFIDGDMRLLKAGFFDAVITMFNAIGHLNNKDFAKALKNIGKNLSENGIYIFDIFNLNAMSDKVVEDLKMDQKFEIKNDKIQQIQYSTLDRKNAILTSYDNYKIEDKLGKIKEINNEFSLQIYCAKELEKILANNGFRVLSFYDIYGKEFIEDKSLNIMVVAQRI